MLEAVVARGPGGAGASGASGARAEMEEQQRQQVRRRRGGVQREWGRRGGVQTLITHAQHVCVGGSRGG